MAKKKNNQAPKDDTLVDNEKMEYPAFEEFETETKVEESTIEHGVLPADVAALFELNWKGGHTFIAGRFGRVDLRKLTVEKAEFLVKNGFKLLVRKG